MRLDLSDAVIIFDLDGTFVDTAGDLAAAMNHALVAAGRRAIDRARVRHLVGRGARAMLERGFEETGGVPASAELDEHLGVFLEYYAAHIADHSRPFPGAIEAISELRSDGARTAICTNKREALARLLIETLGLGEHFDVIVGMDTTSAAKPDPTPVYHCLAATGAARGAFVGDSDTDIRAANSASVPCFVGTFGYGPLTLDGATATFAVYPALAALVRGELAQTGV